MRYVCARSFFARSCLIALCAAAILVLSALPAFAATSYTNPLPAPDSATVVTKPPVKCTVTDPAGVNTTSLIMKLDGLNVRGKWSGSTVTYTPLNPIANGMHTVSVSVLNWAGVRSTYTWSFTVAVAPQIGTMAPADGSVVSVQEPPDLGGSEHQRADADLL